MVKVKIECPVCFKGGYIEVEKAITDNSERGVTAINVQSNIICPHSIIIYIDNNYIVRDCFVSDFTVELPIIDIESLEDKSIEKDFDLYLITLNLNAHALSYILRCCFLDKNFIFIDDSEVLNSHLSRFLEYVFDNRFRHNNKIVSLSQYRKNKKQYKGKIIFSNEKVIKDKNQVLKEKRGKVEEMMIQKFLSERNPETGLIILKNDIYKVFLVANSIINHSVKSNKPINRKLIVDHLHDKFSTGISNTYLDFIFSVLKEYFNVDVFETSDVSEFMNFV